MVEDGVLSYASSIQYAWLPLSSELVDEGQRMAAVEGPWKLAADELDGWMSLSKKGRGWLPNKGWVVGMIE